MNCVMCGNELTGRQLKYCSDSCYNKRYRDANLERISESKKKWYAENIQYAKEMHRRYYKNNREKFDNNKKIHRSRKKEAPTGLTVADWRKAVEFFDNKCAYCGKTTDYLHREHFIPLSKKGGYTKDNIVPACKSCNSKKWSLDPLDWLVTQTHGLVAYVKVTQYLSEQK